VFRDPGFPKVNVSAGVRFDDRLPFALDNWYIQFLLRPQFFLLLRRMPPSITSMKEDKLFAEVVFGMGEKKMSTFRVGLLSAFFPALLSRPSLVFITILIHSTPRTFTPSTRPIPLVDLEACLDAPHLSVQRGSRILLTFSLAS
jgi:hypothetical protein